jgi:ribosome-binding protein aMBF1 (putative translation factor)
MSQEAFPPLRVWDEGLKAHRNYQIVKCSECEAFENMPVTSRTAMPPEVIVKKMQARGWVMSQRRRNDLCPKCAAKKAARPKVTRIADYIAELPKPKEQPMQIEQPRKPTRDEKRLIVLAIEDHYDDKVRSYAAGWSDEKIAADLNVPRKWVSDLREEFYGPVVDAELAELERKVKSLTVDLEAATAVIEAIRKSLHDLKERIAKKMAA